VYVAACTEQTSVTSSAFYLDTGDRYGARDPQDSNCDRSWTLAGRLVG